MLFIHIIFVSEFALRSSVSVVNCNSDVNILAEKLLSTSQKDQLKHLSAVCDNLHLPERGPPSPKHVQLFSYVGTIGAHSVLAGLLSQQGIFSILAKQAKDTHQMEL